MANRDAKKIERTLKDFSLGAMSGEGGSGDIITDYDLFQIANGRTEEGAKLTYLNFTGLKSALAKAGVNMEQDIPDNTGVEIFLFNNFINIFASKNNSHEDPYFIKAQVNDYTIIEQHDIEFMTVGEMFDILIANQEHSEPIDINQAGMENKIGYLSPLTIYFKTFSNIEEGDDPTYQMFKFEKSNWNSIWKQEVLGDMVLNLVCKENGVVETNYTVEEIVKQWETAPKPITIHKYYPEGTCVDEEMGQAYIENIQYMESGDPNARPVMITLGNPFIAENTYIYFDSNIQAFKWMYQSPL